MEGRFVIILSLAVFAVGMTAGFAFYAIFQNQIQVLIPAALLLAFLTWLGSGADFVGLLREWYKEKKQEEKIPKLVFVGFFKNPQGWYFLRVQKTQGEGYVERCRANLTVSNTPIQNMPANWREGSQTEIDIGGTMDLRLFELNESKNISFAREGLGPLDQYSNAVLKIEIFAEKGKVPVIPQYKLSKIINEAAETPRDTMWSS